MRNPREILNSRHAAVVPQLDVIRAKAIRNLSRSQALPSPCPSVWRQAWAELVIAPRRVWGVLGTAWILILALQFGSGAKPTATPAVSGHELRDAWTQQRELLRAELETVNRRTGTPTPPSGRVGPAVRPTLQIFFAGRSEIGRPSTASTHPGA